MTIEVCCAWTCREKGAQFVLEELEGCVRREHLEDQVELVRSPCMGMCRHGVCVRANGKIWSLSPSTARDFFKNNIKPTL